MRVKELHFINEPAVFDIIWSIFKQVMKEKMMKRVSEGNLEYLIKVPHLLKHVFNFGKYFLKLLCDVLAQLQKKIFKPGFILDGKP